MNDYAEQFKKIARPIGTVLCVLTLCILAVMHFATTGSIPVWNYAPIIGIAGEWIVERGISKAKGEE